MDLKRPPYFRTDAMILTTSIHRTRQALCMSLLSIAVGLPLSGCSMMGWNKEKEFVRVVEDTTHPVAEILCLWEPAEGHDMNGLPCRGFAGQILFFGVGEQAPLEVRGDAMIYVFDDHGTDEEQSKPIHQFEFPAESWQLYLRSTNFGASYQLFIPYTRRTSESARCNLRVRYTSPQGRVTFSKIVEISLPGTPRLQPPTTESATSPSSQGVLQAGLLHSADSHSDSVMSASHYQQQMADQRFNLQNTPAAFPSTTSTQISLPQSQLTNQRMAALDQLMSSVVDAEDTPRPAPSPTAANPTPPQEVRPRHILSQAPSTEAAVGSANESPRESTPPSTGRRLHPLVD